MSSRILVIARGVHWIDRLHDLPRPPCSRNFINLKFEDTSLATRLKGRIFVSGVENNGQRRAQILHARRRRVDDDDDDDEELPSEESIQAEEAKKLRQREREEFNQLLNEAREIEERLEKEVSEGDGSKSLEELAKDKAERLREELAKKAQEQAEKRKKAEAMFNYGQRAYGSGEYKSSVGILEAALEYTERHSSLGGEIQIWLAMAYDANGQRSECISTYRFLEKNHPSPKIRQQAADLRYITEAPKLKLTKEEMLTMPLLDYDNNSTSETWSQKVRRFRPKKPIEKDWTDDIWDKFERPRWEKSPYFWFALTVWLSLVGFALAFQT